MTRPSEPPRLDPGLPITPRVATARRLGELGVDMSHALDPTALAEVVAFGFVVNDGSTWVATRITMIIGAGLAPLATTGWLNCEDFDGLMPLRVFMDGCPDNPGPLQAEIDLHRMLHPHRRARPADATIRRCRPTDGPALLDAWRSGRRPVMRTIAWLENLLVAWREPRATRDVADAIEALAGQPITAQLRQQVIDALATAVAATAEWSDWPSESSDEHGHDLDDLLADQFFSELDDNPGEFWDDLGDD